MARTVKGAVRQVARIQGCSIREARRFCEEIQDLAGGMKPSFDTIAACLKEAEARTSLSDKELANRASERHGRLIQKRREKKKRQKRKKRFERLKSRNASVEEFGENVHKNQDRNFQEWIHKNRSGGYVVNLREGDRAPMLHKASCEHLRPDASNSRKSFTIHPKICSQSRKDLRKIAFQRTGQHVARCHHCDP